MNNNRITDEELAALKAVKHNGSKDVRMNLKIDPYLAFKIDFLVGVLDTKTRTRLFRQTFEKMYQMQCEALNIDPDIHLWQLTAEHNIFKPIDYRKLVLYLQKKKYDDME